MTAARPLAVLAVLLLGLAGLKGLSAGEQAAAWFEASAEAADAVADIVAAAPPPAQAPGADGADAAGEGAADASVDGPIARAIAERQAPPEPEPQAAARPALPDFSQTRSSERDVLVSLSERRRALDAREAELDTREALLEVAEQQLQERVSALETLRVDIQALLGQLDERVDTQIDTTVALFAQMEPDAAALVISELDEETKILVAARMQTEQARRFSAILAEMNPQEVARLMLALRLRAMPPDTARALEESLGAAGE